MMLDMHMITYTLKGMFSMIKCGLENKNCGFGINYSPSAYLTHVPSENDKNYIVNKPATLVTPVKAY